MSGVYVLAETLRQLFDAKQYRVADWFIDHCGRGQLEELVQAHGTAIAMRIDYVVKRRLQRRSTSESAGDLVEALPYVLNLWCREGRRSAVRYVLKELDEPEVDALARRPDLDSEVVSMLREFRVNYT
ncbi:hypothetical protein [Dyella sp. GSA-30]|uniref:hypothetical protein n=1 Tax=Dyella sp. GSA-30 TaxID=2994496 RepID=UPI002492B1C8|nr:hypothetical protein [Dyella sp. GSA-30]BDU21029.1 hypothetical protein DYGSA30_24860 [Dyella sp. GSA-30]